MKLFLAALLLAALPLSTVHSGSRRILHVSLYPYIPEPEAAALALKQGFEKLHPEIIVQIELNRNYYSQVPSDKGVLYETADVHEIDVVLMRDFLDHHRLQPPQIAGLDKLEPLARQAATYDDKLWAVPQWMCTDFLFYRSDEADLAQVHSLAALESALRAEHGLLLNLKGDDQLGELYLSSLLAGGHEDPVTVLSRIQPTPDPAILQRFRRLLELEPAGFGRNAAYGNVEGFYARQFARRAGGAFVGYSEMTHEVLDETAQGCRFDEHCVTAGELRVTGFPFDDGRIRPTVWVDMFAIDARTHGQTLIDARNFIRYAVSLPAYRALLVPQPGGIPRALLPATSAAFDDPQIQAAVPLYPAFRAIMEKGVVVAVPHLATDLHAVAANLDSALPEVH